MLLLMTLGSSRIIGIDRLEIDYKRDAKFLKYAIVKGKLNEQSKELRSIPAFVQILKPRHSSSDTAIIALAYNAPPNSDLPATLSFQDLTNNFVIDDDPGLFTITSLGIYDDGKMDARAVAVGCFRNDSAFVMRDVPGTDKYDPIFLTTQIDYPGTKSAINVRFLGKTDYDFDHKTELFFQVILSRAGPRTLFCLDMEELKVEWSLPISTYLLEPSLINSGDSLHPSIMMVSYGPKNRVSDANFMDYFGYLVRIGVSGKLEFNRIIDGDYIGSVLLPLDTSHTRYALSHNLPLREQADTVALPPTSNRLSIIDRDGHLLAETNVPDIIASLWLSDYHEDGALDLYTLSRTGKIRIYDLDLNLKAESEATDLGLLFDTVKIAGQKSPAWVFKTLDGSTAIYSHDFHKLVSINYGGDHWEPLEYDHDDNVVEFILTQDNRLFVGRIEKRNLYEYARMLFWEYETYIIVALAVLSASLILIDLLRRRALRALRKSEARNRAILNASPDITMVLSREGVILDYKARESENSLPQERMIGKKLIEILPLEAAEKVVKTISAALQSGQVHTCEYQLPAPRGLQHYEAHVVILEADQVLASVRNITKHKRIERALQESEQKFRTLAETTAAAIFISRGNRLLYANPAASSISGYSLNELLTIDFSEIVHPDFHGFLNERAQARAQGRSVAPNAEIKILTKQGQEHWINFTVTTTGNGEDPVVIGTAYDITDSKLAEEALKKSEAQYRKLIENQGEGIAITDVEERFVFANPAAEIIFGALPGNLAGQSLKVFTDPDQFALVREQTKRRMMGEKSTYELTIRRADNQSRDLLLTVTPELNESGAWIGSFGIFRDITERKQAQQALRESEEKYRALVEGAREPIFTLNKAGTFLFMNATAGQSLGGTATDFIGKTIWDIFPPLIADRHLSHVRQVIESGQGTTTEAQTFLLDKPRWFRTSIQPLRDSLGEVTSAICIASDITKLVLIEQELRQERDFVHSLLDTANSLIICLDHEARLTVFNEECERLTGYMREEVIGKRWPEMFLPEEIRHPGLNNFAEWVHLHPKDRHEGPLITKSGEIKTILWSNSSIFDPQTGLPTAIAIGHDITDRKLAERALRESEEQLRAQYQSFPIPTFTWKKADADFILVDCNEAALSVTNGVITKLIGKGVRELYQDRPEIYEDIQHCHAEKNTIWKEMEYDFQFLPTNRHCLISYSHVPSDLVLIHMQDITELKRVEKEKLQQAKDIAGGFAHEIRNSLFPAKGALKLINKKPTGDGSGPDSISRYCRITDQSISKALELTNLITQYTKMDTEYFPERVELAEVIEDVVNSNQLLLENQNVKLETSGPTSAVHSNRKQLYLALNNLLLNSIDALTSSANPRIIISWSQSDSRIFLSFSDNGSGISAENLKRIFDVFFSTKPDKGTGLGLSITKRIIEMYGGNISVSSVAGRGATFEIRLRSI